MMIDPATEILITIPEAAKLVPPNGVHVATCWRWTLTGLRDGRKLETKKVGGRVYTSKEALARFLSPSDAQPDAPTSKDRQRQIDAAEKELEAFGV